MAEVVRKNWRPTLALFVMILFALGVTYYILQEQRLRIPILEEKPFTLKAEMADAGAVVAGQGQAIRVAGVKVGEVSEIELDDGLAVVSFEYDRDYLPIYQDATLLLRPQTGLEDMFFQLDPGTEGAGEYAEGDVISVANTAPDVEVHEILAALDADTQAYIRLLLVGAGEGLEGRDKELAELLGGLGPLNRDLAVLNSKVAERKENLSRLVHNFNQLTATVGRSNEELTRLLQGSNSALGRIASEDPDVQAAIARLPGTLATAESTLNELSQFAAVLGPTTNDLRPFARNLDGLNDSVRQLAASTTPVIRDEIRPFVRQAREPIDDLRTAATRYSAAAPRLTAFMRELNGLGNMAAFNPRGAEDCPGDVCAPGRDEGYLYWLGWVGHNGNSVFETQDATGIIRRLYATFDCGQVATFFRQTGAPDTIPGLGDFYDELIAEVGCT
ncbi:MAG: MCE family protein [Solirubrobacterales bacterium]|nr:MCE family protein [Solirubrobacterales bacterium]